MTFRGRFISNLLKITLKILQKMHSFPRILNQIVDYTFDNSSFKSIIVGIETACLSIKFYF